MISTFQGFRTRLNSRYRLGFASNGTMNSNPCQCGTSLSTFLSVSIFLSATATVATKNQDSLLKDKDNMISQCGMPIVQYPHCRNAMSLRNSDPVKGLYVIMQIFVARATIQQ